MSDSAEILSSALPGPIPAAAPLDEAARAARLDAAYRNVRRRLLDMAFRMLGDRADAEDAAQEAYVRARTADLKSVDSYEGFLITIAMRQCLSEKRAARRRREVGYPEADAPDTDGQSPERAAEVAHDLSFALMQALAALSPPERAAFLLHDVFDAPFEAVSAAIGAPVATCRQLASRARRRLRAGASTHKVSREAHERLLTAFAAAVEENRPDRLEALLAADVVAWSNGGDGVFPAPPRQVRGRRKVARLVVGLEKKSVLRDLGYEFRRIRIDGATGLAVTQGGQVREAFLIETDGMRIRAVFAVRDRGDLDRLAKSL